MRGILGFSLLLWAQQPPENTIVPFTLSDKERLIRLESQLQNLQKDIQNTNIRIDRLENYIAKIENRIDRIENRIERLENRLDTYFYTLIGLLVALMGFILWDRRKTLEPVEQKLTELQKDTARLSNLLHALHEYAKNHPDLATLLRQYGAL